MWQKIRSRLQVLYALIRVRHLPALPEINGILQQLLSMRTGLGRQGLVCLLNGRHCLSNILGGVGQCRLIEICLKLGLALTSDHQHFTPIMLTSERPQALAQVDDFN
jgi:hypothetical protein